MAAGNGAVTLRSLSRGMWLAGLAVALAACSTAAPAAEQPRSTQGSSQTSSSQAPSAKPLGLALVPADKAADVAPGEPVTVSATGGRLTEVVVTNQDGGPVAGQLAPDGSTWRSTEGLGYGKSYTTKATGQGADGKTTTATSSFSTAKPRRQANLSMNPLVKSQLLCQLS